jgi:hypothetical protein
MQLTVTASPVASVTVEAKAYRPCLSRVTEGVAVVPPVIVAELVAGRVKAPTE